VATVPVEVERRGAKAKGSATVSRAEAMARRAATGDHVWFSVNVGRSKNADPKWLVPLLCRRGNINKSAIGKIQILAKETRVQIAADVATQFAVAAREPDAKDRNIHIDPVDD
jgi:ATP-dependent RNA helicase DeaD